MQATPRNGRLGLIADALQAAQSYADRPNPTMPMGKANPVLSLIAQALPIQAMATTADRMSYGEPLTNGLRGSKPFMKPETADALLAVMPAPRTAAGVVGMAGDAGGASKAIFAGIGAKTADKAALAQAEKLAAAGTDPKAIWRDTGWFKGGDGKWRFEIDDSAATLKRSYTSNPDHYADLLHEAEARTDGVPLGSALSHPQAFAAYPTAGPLRFKVGGTEGGSFDGKTIRVSDPFAAKAGSQAANPDSTTLHELQHYVQEREGFAMGGSPGDGSRAPFVYGGPADKRMKEMEPLFDAAPYPSPEYDALAREYEALKKQSEAQAAFEGYRRLAGEAEARAVQSRMNMTPQQRREVFPLNSYDVPVKSLIYR